MVAPRPNFTLLLRVSGSNWFDLSGCTQHLYGDACIKGPASYLKIKDRPLPYSRTLCRALPCPHFFLRGPKNHLLPTVFLRNYTELICSPPFVLATYPMVSSPRAPRRRRRNQPACCGGAAFLFHNKTWTIIPTLGSLRVYVHPWSGTVSFLFLPCSRYPNSRKCVHTPLT